MVSRSITSVPHSTLFPAVSFRYCLSPLAGGMRRMRRTHTICILALSFLASNASATPQMVAAAQITVVSGTYGGNCRQPRGNKTRYLAKACNGRRVCRYKIDYKVIGDPAVGCDKDYVAEWRCQGSSRIHRTRVTSEAGYGKIVELRCGRRGKDVAPPPQLDAGQITVVSGTYGGNCRQPRGNKTRFLAKACNGRGVCRYKVDYKVIGDPAVGCDKDYVAEWRCQGSSRIHRTRVTSEAGYGKIVELRCGRRGKDVAPPPQRDTGQITVVSGTYGGNCRQPRGNKTRYLAKACNGRRVCRYKIDYKVIGDPAVGCGKDYVAEWRCQGSSRIHRTRATPEAGYGKIVELRCGGRKAR